MSRVDIGIVGGGLAGSIAAAMLGRAGFSTVLIDRHRTYPDDFRCEKIDKDQLDLLTRTGLAAEILEAATPIEQLWVARFGRLIAKRRNRQFGIAYGDLVNAARAQIPAQTELVFGKIASIATSPDRQTITLSSGQAWSVRLVVLATGLSNRTRQQAGIVRRDVSGCHSISVGFDIATERSGGFEFPALTYFGETPKSRIGYLTLFPMKTAMRANLFVYRDMRDSWVDSLRQAPEETLSASMPNLKRLVGDFRVASKIHVRPVDLYVTADYRRPGIVLAGDCFATSCPAAGTGVNKVLTDVERLCNVHIPDWLSTDGMDIDKINGFYDDPIKIAADAHSAALAWYMRSLTVDTELRWHIRRAGWFALQFTGGVVQSVHERLQSRRRPRSVRKAAVRLGAQADPLT